MVDVGHNPQAARALAEWLAAHPFGRVHAVYGALADKDVAGVIEALDGQIHHWHLASLDQVTPRGLAAASLGETLQRTRPQALFDTYARSNPVRARGPLHAGWRSGGESGDSAGTGP
jgi:dihydrofolate synthase/folylpolyglutamate synthase